MHPGSSLEDRKYWWNAHAKLWHLYDVIHNDLIEKTEEELVKYRSDWVTIGNIIHKLEAWIPPQEMDCMPPVDIFSASSQEEQYRLIVGKWEEMARHEGTMLSHLKWLSRFDTDSEHELNEEIEHSQRRINMYATQAQTTREKYTNVGPSGTSAAASSNPSSKGGRPRKIFDRSDISTWKLEDLRSHCRELKIAGFSRMKRPELVAAILDRSRS